MRAREIMTKPVMTVGRMTNLSELARVMVDRRIGCILVVDEQGKLCGIVTETDFAAKERGVPFSIHILPQVFSQLIPREAIDRLQEAARAATAREIMISEVITATEETPVAEVAGNMLRYDIEHIPVVRDGVPVGIVSRHDLLRMIVQQAEHE